MQKKTYMERKWVLNGAIGVYGACIESTVENVHETSDRRTIDLKEQLRRRSRELGHKALVTLLIKGLEVLVQLLAQLEVRGHLPQSAATGIGIAEVIARVLNVSRIGGGTGTGRGTLEAVQSRLSGAVI